MSLVSAALENEIVLYAKYITGNWQITRKLLMEWRMGPAAKSPIEQVENELQVYIPKLGVWAAFAQKK